MHFLGLFMDSFEFASPKLGLRCIKNQVDKSLIFFFFCLDQYRVDGSEHLLLTWLERLIEPITSNLTIKNLLNSSIYKFNLVSIYIYIYLCDGVMLFF